jgi:hypothetical protein
VSERQGEKKNFHKISLLLGENLGKALRSFPFINSFLVPGNPPLVAYPSPPFSLLKPSSSSLLLAFINILFHGDPTKRQQCFKIKVKVIQDIAIQENTLRKI